MQGASACLAFTESDLSGIQTKSGKKNHQNAQKFLSRTLSSGRHQRTREDSWVLSPDLKWPRFSVSEECSQEGISQLLDRHDRGVATCTLDLHTALPHISASISPTQQCTPSGVPPPPAKPHCNQRIRECGSAQRDLKGSPSANHLKNKISTMYPTLGTRALLHPPHISLKCAIITHSFHR